MKKPLFYAKVLLFGEYGIIEKAEGLTLPFNLYKGSLQFLSKDSTERDNSSNKALSLYASYLEGLELPERFRLDIHSIKKDVEVGMFFNSDIPQGYGVGSSGALVAAIYDKYSLNKVDANNIKREDLGKLKEVFGIMESFFHGKSSGIDPLICYMNIPLFIGSNSEVDMIDVEKESLEGKGAIFLINSGTPGETKPMVNIFFEKLKNEGFRNTLKKEFIKYNNACIRSFINRDMKPFFRNLKKLSSWAFYNFSPMIPPNIMKIWKEGIDSNIYYLKLCGSGGGGYILGFTRDFVKTQKMLKEYHTEVVYRF